MHRKYAAEDAFNNQGPNDFVLQYFDRKTLALKGEKCVEVKKAKQRFAVFIGAQHDAAKLPLLFVIKYL